MNLVVLFISWSSCNLNFPFSGQSIQYSDPFIKPVLLELSSRNRCFSSGLSSSNRCLSLSNRCLGFYELDWMKYLRSEI